MRKALFAIFGMAAMFAACSQTVSSIFPEKEKKNLSMLNKGQRISVICTINDGGNIMGVQGDNCLIK